METARRIEYYFYFSCQVCQIFNSLRHTYQPRDRWLAPDSTKPGLHEHNGVHNKILEVRRRVSFPYACSGCSGWIGWSFVRRLWRFRTRLCRLYLPCYLCLPCLFRPSGPAGGTRLPPLRVGSGWRTPGGSRLGLWRRR